jgi:hypothetical protein
VILLVAVFGVLGLAVVLMLMKKQTVGAPTGSVSTMNTGYGALGGFLGGFVGKLSAPSSASMPAGLDANARSNYQTTLDYQAGRLIPPGGTQYTDGSGGVIYAGPSLN